ncbi:hypothetical protein SUGI_1139490 [Cryptomeria japonica]|nr:hypothetical protein SUGI_1139490 [Cryptomeria japonica]
MRNISSSSTIATTHSLWRSPVPYLMGGLGVMIALILFALLLLLCSHYNHNSREHESENNEMGKENMEVDGCDEMERVVVIMAGNDNPTFIAKPSSIAGPTI